MSIFITKVYKSGSLFIFLDTRKPIQDPKLTMRDRNDKVQQIDPIIIG